MEMTMTNIRKSIAVAAALLLPVASALAQEPAADSGERLATYERNGKIGFVDARGRRVTPARYDELRSVHNGIHVVMANGKRCAVNMAGEEFLPCEYDFIIFPNEERILVRLRGEIFDVDSNGRRIGTPAPLPAPRRSASVAQPPAPVAASRTTANAPAYNRVRALAEARQWGNAIRAALDSTAQDKIYVLLTFRGSSINDMQRWPGQQVVLANMHIFDDAIAAATPEQERQLADMRQSFVNYIEEQARGPAQQSREFRGFIDATTVGECHSRGGTVGVMGYCNR